ncbi:MAG: hypothetical protein HEP71_13710 [Roseivirga sp.]|nr:hypothetical protein [Roseivirga sp.]
MRFFFSLLVLLSVAQLSAQNFDWWDNLHNYPAAAGNDRDRYISISPGYMGPNALRVPVLRNGKIDNELWSETTFEYHSGNGDRTLNIWSEFNIPLAKDKALLYVQSIPWEIWETTDALRNERRAQGRSATGWNTGDTAFGIIVRIANEETSKWPNITFRAHSKTTTGGNISNARFTDASMFFWEATTSKTLSKTDDSSFLIKGMLGFYTWQTNKNFLPNGSDFFQNDAGTYGVGVEYTKGQWFFGSDVSGYHGYIQNRDTPAFLRNQVSYRFKHIALYTNINFSLNSWGWNTFTIGYRHFFKTIE